MALRASIWAKLALAVGAPLVIYGVCELALWAAGVKASPIFKRLHAGLTGLIHSGAEEELAA